MSFGKRGGGGRRLDKRVVAPLPALLVTMSERHPAILSDISETGARLRAKDTPRKGEELFLQVGGLEIYAHVIWTSGDHCGLKFSDPIHGFAVHQLSIEAAKGTGAGMTAAQKGGADDWITGVAR